MKKLYRANNIACGSCSNLIKASLEEEFGEITIDLSKEPREVSVEIKDEKQEIKFKEEMKELGFEIIEE
ncbi:heavy metal transport/detoxification protein [Halarcobacter bivalviorum]|uniref:Heavy metal transport/detoxification protein n=1 Tax=Halarcobacter bivalviorum TaxID=663364 RepID=A0AAX2AAB6_9BACT|nr:heavy metal transport/detoxification protein [Halarcobacter bivalviorum]AXH12695.1 heavy-metal-associated domain-containing protein, putative copper metallochaperone CopZ [Halarcobacter bivalviorum]RXK10381.1 heavy metal transport/detoxification protein [Halarcobacter bivalviorum]